MEMEVSIPSPSDQEEKKLEKSQEIARNTIMVVTIHT